MADFHGEKTCKYLNQHGLHNDKATFHFGGTGQFTEIITGLKALLICFG